MRYLLSRATTVEVEDAAEEAGCTRAELMDRAGAAVARHALSMAPVGRIVVMAGSGNNAGDGWVAARELIARGRQVEVLSSVDPETLRGIAQAAALRAIEEGVRFSVAPEADVVADKLAGASLVIDAMLGTGFAGELREPLASWCTAVNDASAPVLSVDVPSGLYPDTGDSAWGAVQAQATMSCIAVKPGMVGGGGGSLCGTVLVDDLGCFSLLGEDSFTLHSVGVELEADDFKELVPLPESGDNKFSRGAMLVVGGSSAFTGAPMLAGMAAARTGAGYVTIAAPECIVAILQGRLLSIPVRPLAARGGVLDVHAAASVVELAQKARAVVIGPGLGRTRGVAATVSALVNRYEGPLLVDADGLHVLSGLAEEAIARAERHQPLVVTPHFGELLKLAEGAGIDVAELPRHATDEAIPVMRHAKLAVQVARAYGATVVAKGAVPIVTNGATTVFSADGSPSLATAGTGDVLSGVIGGLLAQGLDAVQASILGLHYGGLAARSAAEVRGPGGVIAEDIIDNLGAAMLRTLGR